MADYLPLYTPGESITRQASAAITGGQLVAVSGSGSVAPTSAATAAFVGVAGFDAASGADVTVRVGGVQRLTAVGAIAAGDIVVAAAGGGVATNAAPGAGQQVGVALAAAANGARAEILMVR